MPQAVAQLVWCKINTIHDFVGKGCRDCGKTTKETYLEILEFTHFVDFFSFNRLEENHKEKVLVNKVTVVVALDLGTGNTKNPEL